MKNLKWILKGAKLTGAGIAIVGSGGILAVPLIAQELAENFLLTVIEEGMGEILGMTVEMAANEGGYFIVEGIEGALTNEEVVTSIAEKLELPLYSSTSILSTIGLSIGQVSHETLEKIEKNEHLVNDQADEAHKIARDTVDKTPLTREQREKCDEVLDKLNQTSGICKAIGVNWLFAKKQLISNILQHLQIASVTDEVIRAALQSPITDFENAVTSEAAKAIGLEIIVSRNTSDFVNSSVPTMLPEDLLAALSIQEN